MKAGNMKNGELSASVFIVLIVVIMAGAKCSAARPQPRPQPQLQPHPQPQPQPQPQPPIKSSGALFVFGDSLYDAGNNAYSSKDAGSNFLPYGETYFKKAAGRFSSNFLPYGETYFKKAAGRFSDGRVVPDWIGLPFAPAYLQPNLTDYTKGVNFAYAGAPVLVDDRPGTINMKLQVDNFVAVVGKLKSQMGAIETELLLERAVFLFSVGGVDYVDFCSSHTSTPYTQAALSQLTTMVIGNITSHIQTIYNQGGRRFAFQSVAPLGCMPGVRLAYENAGHAAQACIPEALYVANYHNNLFSPAARNLQSRLPGFKYSIFDYFTQAKNRVLNDTLYGFTDTKDACCGIGKYNGLGNCASQSSAYNLCNDPNQYAWFDSGHPTDKANGQYAQLFWSGPPDVVGPLTVRDLFTGP